MNIGFIGCGNMGGALALAISKASDAKLLLCDTDSAKAAGLSLATGGEVATIGEVAELCDYIFLGIKPAGCATVLEAINDTLAKRSGYTLVSMMAGVSLERIESHLTVKPAIIRIMPNTPVSVGYGMTVYSCNSMVSDGIKAEFTAFMSESGLLAELPEEKIDAACAVMGCGPAFAYMFAESVANGGVNAGLDTDEAILFAAQMMKGAAEMILKSGKTPAKLREEVCSPGGSTIEGVKVLFDKNLPGITEAAVKASFEKTKLLGK